MGGSDNGTVIVLHDRGSLGCPGPDQILGAQLTGAKEAARWPPARHLVDSTADSVAYVETSAPDNGEPTDAEVDDSDVAEAGNGEIARADEFQVTEAERESDRNLAVQLVVAFGIGMATVYGAVPGGLATMLGPLLTTVLNALTRVGHRRAEHAADTLLDAADKAEISVEEFFQRAVADDRRHELFARALTVAQDTAWRNKRRALGRALAAGVMGDEARIDEELLFVRAVDGIDEMHIRPLGRVADGGRLTAGDIALADPGLGHGVLALLANCNRRD